MYSINVENGVCLAVQELNTRGREVLLLVHGWPLSHKMFEYQLDVLPDCGICCATYDLRGYGASDKPDRGYCYDRMADDLFQVINRLNCRSVTLLGFSMGGAIVTRYMARYRGHKVKKLILCGAACPTFIQTPSNPYGMTREEVDGLIRQCASDRPAMVDNFGKLCFASEISDPFRAWFSGICLEASGNATIRSLEALRDEDLTCDLKKIHVPTMILHGRQDKVCPFEFALEQHAAIPNSFIVPFEHSSHCLFYDERVKFTNALIDFTLNHNAC